MCVFRNMIVRSGVFVKSLMNIRTSGESPQTKRSQGFLGALVFCPTESMILLLVGSFALLWFHLK